MSQPREKQNKPQDKSTGKYRIVILDDETLAEVRSMRISMAGFIGMVGFMVLLCFLGAFALISFTPARYLVPGYAEITNNRVYMDLYQRLNEMEEELENQRIYTNGLKNMLNPSGQREIEGLYPAAGEQEMSLSDFYFIAPVKGEISASFNREKSHLGTDIIAPRDTPVKSILDGVVVNADWSVRNGNTISIQHSNNIISVYKHNSTLLKNTGDRVFAGEAIAIIGNTGEQTTGPHVHFELWHRGLPVDPEEYITFE